MTPQMSGELKGPNQLSWSPENLSASFVKEKNLATRHCLFDNHRIAAIHLRNCSPNRYRVKLLAILKSLDECLALTCDFLTQFDRTR